MPAVVKVLLWAWTHRDLILALFRAAEAIGARPEALVRDAVSVASGDAGARP